MGGARQQRMIETLTPPGGAAEFEVGFAQGVSSRDLRTRSGLLSALVETGLLPHSAATASVGTEAASVADRVWLQCRNLSRQRAVLACALAHLRAMRRAVEEGWDLICEDNIRGPVASGEAARRIRACAEASRDAHLRYYTYSGRAEELSVWYREMEASGPAALPWPLVQYQGAKGSGENNLLFGAMCYAIGG